MPTTFDDIEALVRQYNSAVNTRQEQIGGAERRLFEALKGSPDFVAGPITVMDDGFKLDISFVYTISQSTDPLGGLVVEVDDSGSPEPWRVILPRHWDAIAGARDQILDSIGTALADLIGGL